MENRKLTNEEQRNFFNAMSYELAGEIGAIDNEEMKKNHKLITNRGISKKIDTNK